jgi:hypothetical protein
MSGRALVRPGIFLTWAESFGGYDGWECEGTFSPDCHPISRRSKRGLDGLPTGIQRTHRAKGSGIRGCIGTFQAVGRPNFPAIEKEPMPQAADMFATPLPLSVSDRRFPTVNPFSFV